ncbi:MAG: hypothetical protein ABR525_11660, partial [Candidatus Limnocylindria bacterium]
MPDPLAPHRLILGDARGERLSELADELAPSAAAQDRTELRAHRDRAATAWERLDRPGAYETRAIQTDRDVAATRARKALTGADTLEQRAARAGGRRHRPEHDALRQA